MTSTIKPPRDGKLRMALIGGGGEGFFGRVHALAAGLDQRAELVAGAFSSDPDKSRLAAAAFGVAPDRGYGSYRELFETEARLPADRRVDFVTIATPNHTHFEIAQAALKAGFHVVCEKPLTNDLDQALELAELVARTGAVFVVAHGYSGYPLVRQAREMIAAGELGQVFAARVAYLQGGKWSIEPGQKPARAAWKGDPAKAGPSGTLADIGTHAFHLLRYTTGLQPEALCAALARFHPGRPLDDYGHVMLRCCGGELATIAVSQVTHGQLNDLSLEVDGTRGSLVWRQMDPDQLVVRRHNQPVHIYQRSQRTAYSDTVRAACRLPGGHPEGFLEALANLYADGFDAIIRGAGAGRTEPSATSLPDRGRRRRRRILYPVVPGQPQRTGNVEAVATGGQVTCDPHRLDANAPRPNENQMTAMKNLLADIPATLPDELLETLVHAASVRIERIVSHGQASPEGFWYDQPQHEWVVLWQGAARLRFQEDEEPLELRPGDFVNIPAHARHRVEWTAPAEPTVWLAVHYSGCPSGMAASSGIQQASESPDRSALVG